MISEEFFLGYFFFLRGGGGKSQVPLFLTLFKEKCIKIACLFKMLNSTIEYFLRLKIP